MVLNWTQSSSILQNISGFSACINHHVVGFLQVATTNAYALEISCFLICLAQFREFPLLLGQVSTGSRHEVDA